jgi:hypothetical protein
MERECLQSQDKQRLGEWDDRYGAKDAKDQIWETHCGCFKAVRNPGKEDVWKGHICTTDISKFESPAEGACVQV